MALSREAQNIDPVSWYYEYPTYLLVVHEARYADGKLFRTDSFKLPWKMIDKSRKRKPPKLRR